MEGIRLPKPRKLQRTRRASLRTTPAASRPSARDDLIWLAYWVPAIWLCSWRFVPLAKVGKNANWYQSLDPSQRSFRDSAVQGGRGDEVRLLKRHRKRLHALVIEAILAMDLRDYELSRREEVALRTALLETGPNRVEGMDKLRRHLVQLVRYGNRVALWDVSKPKELFKQANLTLFMVEYIQQVSEGSYNEARTALVNAGRVLDKTAQYRQVPPGSHVPLADPTDEPLLEEQWLETLSLLDRAVTWQLIALICMSRGAGLRSEDIVVVHGTDVRVRQGGRTTIRVTDGDHDREVIVLRRFAAPLQKAAAWAGDALILAGVDRNRGPSEYLRSQARTWDLERVAFPNVDVLANAYFLEIAQRRVSVKRIFTVLRGVTIRKLEDLNRLMDPLVPIPDDDIEGLEDNGLAYFSPPADV